VLYALRMCVFLTSGLSGLYYVASNYLIFVIYDSDNMRPRKPTENVRQGSR
jgi:hypothetical protein